jgi:hypothetical protein
MVLRRRPELDVQTGINTFGPGCSGSVAPQPANLHIAFIVDPGRRAAGLIGPPTQRGVPSGGLIRGHGGLPMM